MTAVGGNELTITTLPARRGYELVVRCSLERCGYLAYIAIHSTHAGPAVGGIRFRAYAKESGALADALRLSRAMTLKCALAGVPLGGGKSVVLARDGAPREPVFRAHGRAIATLRGRYIGAPDLGTGARDLEAVRSKTPHVAGLRDGIGDPGPFTARGVRRAMEAAALVRWGASSLSGRVVAVQGCGSVGAALCAELSAAGAALVVVDPLASRADDMARRYGARSVPVGAIATLPVDVFAPCAAGGILDAETVAGLRAAIVCGAANNQLPARTRGRDLMRRRILYVPDFAANAGGVISGGGDLLGWSGAEVASRIDSVFDTVLDVLERSRRSRRPPAVVAEYLATRRLASLPQWAGAA
jgi:leucine dehydrogenase